MKLLQNKRKIFTTAIILLILVITITAITTFRFLNTSILPAGKNRVFEVQPGTPIEALAEQLYTQRLIDYPHLFEWYAIYTGQSKQLKAGEYLIKGGMTPRQLLNLFTSGRVIEHSITFIEGWNLRQFLTALLKKTNIKLAIAEQSPSQIAGDLKITYLNPEGWFFPATYRYTKGLTDKAILLRAYQKMQQILQQEWQQRDSGLPFETAYQALTLASIVEKEAKLSEERPLVAGVFIRRLQTGMRLQSNATVRYGLSHYYPTHARQEDIRIDTPYNSYLHAGLPPTPIASPSQSSIHAVLHPQGRSLYFVARGDGEGGHYFSNSYRDHLQAVKKYRQNQENNRSRSVPPDAIMWGTYLAMLSQQNDEKSEKPLFYHR